MSLEANVRMVHENDGVVASYQFNNMSIGGNKADATAGVPLFPFSARLRDAVSRNGNFGARGGRGGASLSTAIRVGGRGAGPSNVSRGGGASTSRTSTYVRAMGPTVQRPIVPFDKIAMGHIRDRLLLRLLYCSEHHRMEISFC